MSAQERRECFDRFRESYFDLELYGAKLLKCIEIYNGKVERIVNFNDNDPRLTLERVQVVRDMEGVDKGSSCIG